VLRWLRRYAQWLHTRWPAGTVERFPEVREDGSTRVPGLFVSGDLTGIPLLKFALDSGVRVVRRIAAESELRTRRDEPGVVDLAIVGAGVSGLAAAMEARTSGLRFEIFESAEPLFTLENFPRAKPIYTYPTAMKPAGALQVQATTKETLIDELRAQVESAGIAVTRLRIERVERDGDSFRLHAEDGNLRRARRVLVAIGRSGHFRTLDVPGEQLPKVYHRLHDPADFAGQRVVVVGGGDSAIETAIAIVQSGGQVTLCHRGSSFSRAKSENRAMLEALKRDPAAEVEVVHPVSEQITAATAGLPHRQGSLSVRLETTLAEIREREVVLRGPHGTESLLNDVVFAMVGREPPLDFFRNSGVRIAGEMTPARWTALGLFLLFCVWLYDWKSGGFFSALWYRNHWFPTNLADLLAAAGQNLAAAAADRHTLIGTLAISASSPSFYYTLAYSAAILWFGLQRIRRRRTPYVSAQTATLIAIQVIPLFLLPEILLPLLDANGWLPRALADALFPHVDYGHGREFWRAYGLILAWPLNVYNVFTPEPLPAWLAISFVQTLVLIPLGIWFFGKGVYCGWICSCGGLAETLGDQHRHKMPHGPGWNRANLAGQVVLAVAVLLLVVRIAGWVLPDGNAAARVFPRLQDSYKWAVDVFLAGVLGYGVYFWFSGRFWCRFLCPLAALMHVFARFSSFRILADKKKCISCGQCTRVCHQGIDVMSFANKGTPMSDPECVRCSACVGVCPTGVLEFGRVDRAGREIGRDRLLASLVQIAERER
jgi:NosR/NirI family transcriptional regulator, nitrous oxide reductase regulator